MPVLRRCSSWSWCLPTQTTGKCWRCSRKPRRRGERCRWFNCWNTWNKIWTEIYSEWLASQGMLPNKLLPKGRAGLLKTVRWTHSKNEPFSILGIGQGCNWKSSHPWSKKRHAQTKISCLHSGIKWNIFHTALSLIFVNLLKCLWNEFFSSKILGKCVKMNVWWLKFEYSTGNLSLKWPVLP